MAFAGTQIDLVMFSVEMHKEQGSGKSGAALRYYSALYQAITARLFGRATSWKGDTIVYHSFTLQCI